MSTPWLVVEFEDESTVVIPNSWFMKNEKKKTYEEAKEKLDIALEHSDVDLYFSKQQAKENRSIRHKKEMDSDSTDADEEGNGLQSKGHERVSILKSLHFPPTPPALTNLIDSSSTLTSSAMSNLTMIVANDPEMPSTSGIQRMSPKLSQNLKLGTSFPNDGLFMQPAKSPIDSCNFEDDEPMQQEDNNFVNSEQVTVGSEPKVDDTSSIHDPLADTHMFANSIVYAHMKNNNEEKNTTAAHTESPVKMQDKEGGAVHVDDMDNMSMPWMIVEFDDESTAIIPNSWFMKNDKKSSWPPYRTDRQNSMAVRKREIPQTTWRTYGVRRIFCVTSCDLLHKFIQNLKRIEMLKFKLSQEECITRTDQFRHTAECKPLMNQHISNLAECRPLTNQHISNS
ncbi:hypothetical protein TSAR_004837 [Trichomalopsis sarcophagae]|uniref:Uncharacterized protein n=1 Tax=Trichomalopsis sarcophagae TaxID=543379 RepID=A0A232EE05_9HYME|nr:hypothetical protein TSAR_004837 [Trichomalopsis sarcophagae]